MKEVVNCICREILINPDRRAYYLMEKTSNVKDDKKFFILIEDIGSSFIPLIRDMEYSLYPNKDDESNLSIEQVIDEVFAQTNKYVAMSNIPGDMCGLIPELSYKSVDVDYSESKSNHRLIYGAKIK